MADSRRKGHDWERDLCKRLRSAGARSAERVLTEPRDGNARGDIATDLPLVIQAKCGKAPNPWKALEEAEEAARARNGGGRRYPVGIVKRLRGGGRQGVEMAVMPLETFEEIVRELRKAGVW